VIYKNEKIDNIFLFSKFLKIVYVFLDICAKALGRIYKTIIVI